jgi:mannose-6-phosphate isomerase-like protein (cupin superfamily)
MILLGGTAASGFGRAKASLFPWVESVPNSRLPAKRPATLSQSSSTPVAPRTLVPPHVHHDTDEYSYVVEGQFGARIGDEIFLADPGTMF